MPDSLSVSMTALVTLVFTCISSIERYSPCFPASASETAAASPTPGRDENGSRIFPSSMVNIFASDIDGKHLYAAGKHLVDDLIGAVLLFFLIGRLVHTDFAFDQAHLLLYGGVTLHYHSAVEVVAAHSEVCRVIL